MHRDLREFISRMGYYSGRPRQHRKPVGAEPQLIAAQVPASDIARLDELADAKGLSRSALVRQAIAALIASSAGIDEEAA